MATVPYPDRARVAIVGDPLLDEDVRGVILRQTPEDDRAPVLSDVLVTHFLGGAANVAYHAAGLTGPHRTNLYGLSGANKAVFLSNMLKLHDVQDQTMAVGADQVVKQRFYSRAGLVLRADRGDVLDAGPYGSYRRQCLDLFAEHLTAQTVPVLVDYGAGLFNEDACAPHFVKAAGKHGVFVLAEPHALERWRHFASPVTVFKANEAAAVRAVQHLSPDYLLPVPSRVGGPDSMRHFGAAVLRALIEADVSCYGVWLTLGHLGSVLALDSYSNNGPATISHAFETAFHRGRDSIGAGDVALGAAAAWLARSGHLHDRDALIEACRAGTVQASHAVKNGTRKRYTVFANEGN